MVIRTNVMALNSNNALNKANGSIAGSMEKLSTGFRINKAADDASGLSISEKMKAQIKALDTAVDNCEDGANMIQTAEGYMAETQDMLNRMVELAEKSANGVLDDTDRDALQDEMNQLSAEIDRIATTANFNGRKLMDGSIGGSAAVTVAVSGTQLVYTAPTDMAGASGINLQIGESSTSADRLEVKINSFHTDTLFGGIDGEINSTIDGTNVAAKAAVKVQDNTADGGATGISTYKQAKSVDIRDCDNASAAADYLRQISNYVSDERGRMGALQNRLEHTVNNLTTASENTSAANSRIRDTDMAKEMIKYTSTNVITQAAQAMLAQANTQPQNVLQLLQ
ncbi:MAG: flagellin [Ruminococcus sp.]|nr:flagellin [Ruminococcus sp.]